MFENQSLAEIEYKLKIKLNDYSLFKKYVKYNSKLDKATLFFIGMGLAYVLFNVFDTFNEITKLNLPLNSFFNVFLAPKGNLQDLKLTYVFFIGLISLFLGVLLKIFNILKKESNYKRIYNEFISTNEIIKKYAILLFNSYYILFKNENDTKKMIDLLNSGAFNDNNKLKKLANISNFKRNYTYLSKYLIDKFGFSDAIQSVFLDSFNNKNNILICNSGAYQLFIKSRGLHIIKVNEITRDDF